MAPRKNTSFPKWTSNPCFPCLPYWEGITFPWISLSGHLFASLEEVCGGSHDQCAASPNEDDFPWSSVTNGLSRARHVGSQLWHMVLQRAVMFWLSTSYLIIFFRSWKCTHTVSYVLVGIWLLSGLTHAFTHEKDKGFPAAQPTAELLVKAAANKVPGSVVSGTVSLVLAFSSPLCSQWLWEQIPWSSSLREVGFIFPPTSFGPGPVTCLNRMGAQTSNGDITTTFVP